MTVVRIWMRIRGVRTRAWRAANDKAFLFGARGKGAQRAAWAQSFRAEAAALRGQAYAASLLDLVKAFERIPHD